MAKHNRLLALYEARDNLQNIADALHVPVWVDDDILMVGDPPGPTSNFYATVVARGDDNPCRIIFDQHPGFEEDYDLRLEFPAYVSCLEAMELASKLNSLAPEMVVARK